MSRGGLASSGGPASGGGLASGGARSRRSHSPFRATPPAPRDTPDSRGARSGGRSGEGGRGGGGGGGSGGGWESLEKVLRGVREREGLYTAPPPLALPLSQRRSASPSLLPRNSDWGLEASHLRSASAYGSSPSEVRPLSYRGTSLIRNTPRLGPYSWTIPRVLRCLAVRCAPPLPALPLSTGLPRP